MFLKTRKKRINKQKKNNNSNISDINLYICINIFFLTVLNNGIVFTISAGNGFKNAKKRTYD